MDFGNAIRELKNGKSLYRKGWNGKGICIKLMNASDSQDMTQDYIYIDTTGLKTDNRDAPKSRVPWLASQTDLLANDWKTEEQVQKTSNGKISFIDVDGKRHEELSKGLTSVESKLDNNKMTYQVNFYGTQSYQISEVTYEIFVKNLKILVN